MLKCKNFFPSQVYILVQVVIHIDVGLIREFSDVKDWTTILSKFLLSTLELIKLFFGWTYPLISVPYSFLAKLFLLQFF